MPIISAVLLPYIFFILYGFTEHVVIKDGICEYVYIHIVYIRFKVVDIISIERAIVPKIGYRGAQIYMLNLKIKCSDREQERFISIHNFSNKTVDNLLKALGYVRVKNEIITIVEADRRANEAGIQRRHPTKKKRGFRYYRNRLVESLFHALGLGGVELSDSPRCARKKVKKKLKPERNNFEMGILVPVDLSWLNNYFCADIWEVDGNKYSCSCGAYFLCCARFQTSFAKINFVNPTS